jgi:hypothetical protein
VGELFLDPWCDMLDSAVPLSGLLRTGLRRWLLACAYALFFYVNTRLNRQSLTDWYSHASCVRVLLSFVRNQTGCRLHLT